MVWRFLLRLPDNATSHSDLTRKGMHTAYAELHHRFPMKDHRLYKRLRRCCSALAHWSPVFGELTFLPELAFPFVKLFGACCVQAVRPFPTVVVRFCLLAVSCFG